MDADLNLGRCMPIQILNLNEPINDVSTFKIFDNCNMEYPRETLRYSYSLDGVCWSCYMTYDEVLRNLIDVKSDYFIRAKVGGIVNGVEAEGEKTDNYTTQLDSEFNLQGGCENNSTANTYQPYNNLDNAVGLYQQLSESVSCVVGIPIYYFKLSGNAGSTDITFKEYALKDVEAVKQIKLIVNDNNMPSSKPTFTDFGLDWETDWETEISKATFATAFGNTAQPTEGDLIYIPMMKRMWMVNEAYEEKKDAFMWNATTFKLALVKYQEKGSVDLGDTEDLVNSFIKNKYDDLFGEDENLDSGNDFVDAPSYSPHNMYSVFESDATRKYVSCDNNHIYAKNVYHKNTLISDYCYDFSANANDVAIIYQNQYCGDDCSGSFIVKFNAGSDSKYMFSINNIKFKVEQDGATINLSIINNPDLKITLTIGDTYFVWFRWNRLMNYSEISAAKHTYNPSIPLYKLTDNHWYFDIDNATTVTSNYNIELSSTEKGDVQLYTVNGYITNIKVYDIYIDSISELLMMYPTSQHLIINDTCRKLIDLHGVSLR